MNDEYGFLGFVMFFIGIIAAIFFIDWMENDFLAGLIIIIAIAIGSGVWEYLNEKNK